jgi:steroid 5-alpha reductase family enzyme
MEQKTKDKLILLFIYIVSFSVGTFIGNSYIEFGLLAKSAMIVFATVLVIWLFSFVSNNSSVFDPYWSVAPPFFTLYFWISAHGFQLTDSSAWFSNTRFILVLVLVSWWGARLTYNFLRQWKGLKHEDWRYVDFRKKTGVFYWLVSFFGIHLFPAIMVWFGCLSLWITLVAGIRPMNFLDIAGLLLTGFAIWLETKADKELHQFVQQAAEGGKTLNKGLWSVSRHPNYLGEMTFWWGLCFIALAANPSAWWVIIGPLAITIMFVFISIPMIEKRLRERKSDYGEYCKQVPMLFPIPFGKRK